MLAHLWGTETDAWIGRSLELYRDGSVLWAGAAVGGIRISAASHITRATSLSLQYSRGKSKMSKRGSKYLRTAAIQAADVAVFVSGDPLFKPVYDRQKERGKPHCAALSHVANKLLHGVFSGLKNQRPYTPILN